MLDLRLRPTKDAALDPLARRLPRAVTPAGITGASLGVTLLAAGLAALGRPLLALSLWLAGRFLDGLDGALARCRGTSSDLGGFLDLLGDTVGYVAVPLGVAIGVDERSTWIAVSALMGTFYVNALSWSFLAAVLEKRGVGASATGETTSITMPPALVEGSETIVLFGLFIVLSQWAPWLFGLMAALVAVNVVQRVAWARRNLD